MKNIFFIIPITILTTIIVITIYLTFLSKPDKYNQHVLETEICVNTQIKLKRSIDKFKIDKNINNLIIATEEDFNNLLKNLLNENYINNAKVGIKGCNYIYCKNDSENFFFCIKHGDVDYAKGYKIYKVNLIIDKVLNFIISFIGIIILSFAVFRR